MSRQPTASWQSLLTGSGVSLCFPRWLSANLFACKTARQHGQVCVYHMHVLRVWPHLQHHHSARLARRTCHCHDSEVSLGITQACPSDCQPAK